MSKTFTEEDISEFVFENVITEETIDSGRWTETVVTVFEHEGKFYETSWQRGLTENQENEFYGSTATEVFPVTKVSAKVETVYVEDPTQNNKLELGKKPILAAKLVSDDAEKGIEAIKSFDAGVVLNFLKEADTAILTPEASSFLEASRDFFTAIQKVQKEL